MGAMLGNAWPRGMWSPVIMPCGTRWAESAQLQVLRLSRDDFSRLHRSGVLDASVVAELQRVRTARQAENRRTLSMVSRSRTGGGGVDL